MTQFIFVVLVTYALSSAPDVVALGKEPHHQDQSDGTIAFMYQGNVWVMNVDGSEAERLTTFKDRLHDRFVMWSPDGTKIAFSRHSPTEWDLWVIEVKTKKQENLTKELDGEARSYAWSPSGHDIAFMHTTGLALVNLETKAITLLKLEGHRDAFPSWSPKGRRLISSVVWRRRGSNRMGVRLVDPLSGKSETLNVSGSCQYASWSADGKRLFLQRR